MKCCFIIMKIKKNIIFCLNSLFLLINIFLKKNEEKKQRTKTKTISNKKKN